MSISFLHANRTQYRNLLEKELGNGLHLLKEDIKQGEIKIHFENMNNCIKGV